jgi:hypothetical protein
VTSLVPVSQPGKDLDLTGDLAAVLRRISAAKAVAEAESPTDGLARVQVKQEALEALDKLSGLLKTIEFPKEPRELAVSELKDHLTLATESKLAIQALDQAVEAVKQAFFDDLDIKLLKDQTEAELEALKDVEKGWYNVGGEREIPDTGKRFKREIAESQPQLTAEALRKLWKDGKISRADYYAMTVPNEARRFDGDRFLTHLKKKPKLIEKLADIIVPGKMTARFYVRDVKKKK